MQEWAVPATDVLWRTALTAIPLTLLVMVVCRLLPFRPVTRHALWLTLVLWFAVSPLLPDAPVESLVPARSELVMADTPPGEPQPRDWRQLESSPPATARPSIDARAEPRLPAWLASAAGSDGLLLEQPHQETGPTQNTTIPPPPHPVLTAPRAQDCPARPADPIRPTATVSALSEPSWPPPVEPSGSRLRTSAPDPVVACTSGKTTAVGLLAPAADSKPAGRPVNLWARWLAGMAAVSALPPLPAGVWLGGTLLVVVIGAVRVFRSQRRLSRAYPPAESVQRMTTEIAETLGLRRVPEVLMVDAAVSPMIWCGRRARLMLPGRLWDELDDPGRRAVLCHELAHLRRRDHQVRWVELLVAAVYWWHPVVWWVRRRLQEEADLCCDAWVTWLMPQGRRAYAEALLQTKRYVNDNTMPVPAVGMAMTSRRARSFARRLTMLMTSSCKPKLSASGVVLAVALATACWMATPAQSSPLPDKPAAAEAPEVPAVPVFLVSGDDDNLEKRMKRLEKRMDKLTDKLDSLLDALGDGKHDGDQKGKAKLKQRSKTAPRAPRPPRPPRPSKGDRTRIRAPEMKIEFEGSKGESVVRAYELPPGKLGALTELMVRDDVPVLVEPGEEAIKVHGTAWQHATFEAFVDMIHASDRPAKLRKGELVDRAYKLTGGKLEALTGLMVRDDVPILVQPMAEALGVHATEAHQEIFEAFVDLIHPSGAAPPPRSVAETTKGEVVVRTYALPEEKLDILTELMVREDVPVLVRPVEGGIEVHGTKDQQAVFEAFVNMVHPTGGKAKGQKARRGGGAWLEALKSGAGEELRQQLKVKAAERARAEAEAQVRSAAMAKQAHASEAATGVATAQFEVDVLETQIKQNRNRARMLDEEARRLQKRAQKLATEAKEFEDQARALDDEANGS